MRRFAAACAMVVFAGISQAQETEVAPRVTGQEVAEAATVIINEVNSDAYPDVMILATVLRDGEPVEGLTDADFRVREDEVDQEPLSVAPRLPPLSVVLAIDTSGSMSRAMDDTRAAASRFVASLDDSDSVQLLTFEREIATPTGMTTQKAEVQAAIDAIVARGDTRLYDAMHESVGLVAEREGRKAIIVLSDGVDDDGAGQPLSEATLEDVLARAAEVNVPIFTIGLGTEMDEAVLTDVADRTGGQYLNAPEAGELAEIYDRIGARLSGQYAISYTSRLPADGSMRRVDLAALGARDSKTYAPAGASVPDTAPDTADASCAIAAAIETEGDALRQASDRHGRNLISISDRDGVRVEAMKRIGEAMAAGEPDLACIRSGLELASAFHDENLIAISQRDALRDDLAAHLEARCAARRDEDGLVACLTFYRDAHNDSLLAISTRDALRSATLDAIMEVYLAGDVEADTALEKVAAFYNDGLIAIGERDSARQSLLAR